MKVFLLVLSAALILAPQAWAQAFFIGLPDIPLMPGTVELEERGLAFDKPEGRILVAVALVDDSVSDSHVQRYYSQALPQFGWSVSGPLSFERGAENLQMAFLTEGENRVLEITISP